MTEDPVDGCKISAVCGKIAGSKWVSRGVLTGNRYMSQYGMKTLFEFGFADDMSESC